jgi:hypothetical protein
MPGRRERSIHVEFGTPQVIQICEPVEQPAMSALSGYVRSVGDPTVDDPESGEIRVRGVILSAVAYWREDGVHVFRSTEYDVIAADEDRDTAARTFIEKSEDYAEFLSDSDGDPTEDDIAIATMIVHRLLEGYAGPEDADCRRELLARVGERVRSAVEQSWHRPAPRT